MHPIFKSLCLVAGLLGVVEFSSAGVIVGATRVIYEAGKKEASISVSNSEKMMPYLIQSWVESPSEADTSRAPFIITPPLFRLNAGQENILRIVRAGGQLPDDRESQYWLSIKSIPSTEQSDQNQLLISIKTRIKLIYRPSSLSGNAGEAYKALTFSRQGNQLHVKNPTPYYVAFNSVKVGSQEIEHAGTVAPHATLSWPLPNGAGKDVSWKAINDYGGITPAANAAL